MIIIIIIFLYNAFMLNSGKASCANADAERRETTNKIGCLMGKSLLHFTALSAVFLITGGVLYFTGSTVLQSFLILTREGFEVILVITALATYLRKIDQHDRVWVVYQGVFWALAASFATAYLMVAVFGASNVSREAFEGVTMLIAAAVLFYVSCWLFAKRELERWRKYVHKKIDKALSGGKLFALGFAAFLAVYREGAETVLFYQAMFAGSEVQTSHVVIGFVAAVFCLGGIFVVMRTASYKLPIGVFFTGTAAFLYYLAFVFAGKGVHELQESSWVSLTPIDWMPRIDWLGVYPTIETATAQFFLFAPLMVATVWWICKSSSQALVNAGDSR